MLDRFEKTVFALVIIGVIVAIWGPIVFAAEPGFTPRQAAGALAKVYVSPLTSPDLRRVHVATFPCRGVGRGWYACRSRVTGEVTCRMIVHVRGKRDGDYLGWVPRMRCR